MVEKLDLCSLKSVREFVECVTSRQEPISILVCNAGVMMCPQGKTEDGFETHIGSNHLGHALLSILLLPTLIKNGPSRIIFVSSYLHESKIVCFMSSSCHSQHFVWSTWIWYVSTGRLSSWRHLLL